MIDSTISILKSLVTAITNGITGLLGKFFVTEGYITSTTINDNNQVKSDLKKEDTSIIDDISNYWSSQWENVETAASKAWEASKTAFYAAGNTLKEVFWTQHVNAWNDIKKTYNKYWRSASKRYDLSKEKNNQTEIQKKKKKVTVDLAKLASAIPGFQTVQDIADMLYEFADTVSMSYKDLSNPRIDPTTPITSLLEIIQPIIEAFEPLQDFIGDAMPPGLSELPKILDMLLAVNDGPDTKTITKFRPEIPPVLKDAFETAKEAMASTITKSATFIIFVICKILEKICEILEYLGAGEIPVLKQVTAILKTIPLVYSLITEGPAAIKMIFEGTGRKLMALAQGKVIGSFPEQIDINIFGNTVATVTNTEPTLQDVQSLKLQLDVKTSELYLAEHNPNYDSDKLEELRDEVADLQKEYDEYNSVYNENIQIVSGYEINKGAETLLDETVKSTEEYITKIEQETSDSIKPDEEELYVIDNETDTITPDNDLEEIDETDDMSMYADEPVVNVFTALENEDTVKKSQNSALAIQSSYDDTIAERAAAQEEQELIASSTSKVNKAIEASYDKVVSLKDLKKTVTPNNDTPTTTTTKLTIDVDIGDI